MIIENDLTAIPGCLNAETDTQTAFLRLSIYNTFLKSYFS